MKNRRGICGFVLLPECTSYKLPPFSPSLIFPFSSVISYVLFDELDHLCQHCNCVFSLIYASLRPHLCAETSV